MGGVVTDAKADQPSSCAMLKKHAPLIVAAFLSAVGFAGSLHLDVWLASWAAHPVQLFRLIARSLFYWVPKDWVDPEYALMGVLLYGTAVRGLIIEGTAKPLLSGWEKVGIFDRIMAAMFTAGMLFVIPFGAVFAVETIRLLALGYLTFALVWELMGIYALIFLALAVWAAYFLLSLAPRSFAYFAAFLILFYGWGVFVSGDYVKSLPMPSNAAQAKP
jgi:hypothetical protein